LHARVEVDKGGVDASNWSFRFCWLEISKVNWWVCMHALGHGLAVLLGMTLWMGLGENECQEQR